MSRAFVKEPDGDAADADLPDRPLSEHPLYVTPRGLRKLQEDLHGLREQQRGLQARGEDMTAMTELKRVERDVRYFEQCVQNAIVVAPPASHDEVRFGAAVDLLDEEGHRHQIVIVGEQEACAPTGLISWVSPHARSLIGRRVGDVVIWERPAGNIELEITGISYPDLT